MNKYSFWKKDITVQWVSCVDPLEDADRMTEQDPDVFSITTAEIMDMIHAAVLDSRKDEFYAQLCSPKKLLIVVAEPYSIEKEALQFELSVIMSVRRVSYMPTRVFFPSDFDPAIITNQSLSIFLHMADRGMPIRRMHTGQGLFRRLAEIAWLSEELDDPLFPEEDEEGVDAEGRSLSILREIRARTQALERQISHPEPDPEPTPSLDDWPL